MRIGIFAEGWSDYAVLRNILIGVLGKDIYEDVEPKRPEFAKDETDLHEERKFSNWTLVKQDCVEGRVRDFLKSPFEDDVFAIIQIDTAECGDANYEVKRPAKGDDYCQILRENVIAKINEWLDDDSPKNVELEEGQEVEEVLEPEEGVIEEDYKDCIFYAICIEEVDAWVLALYQKDTHLRVDPKRRLEHHFSSSKKLKKDFNRVKNHKALEKWDVLSKDFQKNKRIEAACKNNPSLKDFVESLVPLKNLVDA